MGVRGVWTRVAPESGWCVSVQELNLPQVGAYMIELLLIAPGLWWPLKSSLSNQSFGQLFLFQSSAEGMPRDA